MCADAHISRQAKLKAAREQIQHVDLTWVLISVKKKKKKILEKGVVMSLRETFHVFGIIIVG